MNTQTVHKRAVLFLRARHTAQDSNAREWEHQLIGHQRAVCEQAATVLDAKIIREYVEFGGAGSIEKRPTLRLMLDELRALRDTDYVIVASPDRLVRRTHDAAAISLELEAAGAELVTATNIIRNKDRKEVPV